MDGRGGGLGGFKAHCQVIGHTLTVVLNAREAGKALEKRTHTPVVFMNRIVSSTFFRSRSFQLVRCFCLGMAVLDLPQAPRHPTNPSHSQRLPGGSSFTSMPIPLNTAGQQCCIAEVLLGFA